GLWKGKEPLFFCSKIRNEVDKKLFQARVTSLEQLLSTVWGCDKSLVTAFFSK
ncbi:IS5/IS1182 family transposase, partial [Enterococcus faecium]|nr:IS5/IS1182 family transposase [Enterococcus faecium]